MKKFLIIFILILTFQVPSWADDISEFQIEGLSLYDKLTNYYSKEKINDSDLGWWEGKKYKTVAIVDDKNFKDFMGLQISFKRNDSTYKIENIDALNYINIEDCYKEFDQTERQP